MAAGYDLKEGKYNPNKKAVKDMKMALNSFFEKTSKKESTYKYVLFKSIIDNIEAASGQNNEISFDKLFVRFAEIYWVLVYKHELPQKIGTIYAPETMAEKIIHELSEKYNIKKYVAFDEVSSEIKIKMIDQLKKKCSRYVFGALYADTECLLYSFSIKEEWVRLNPNMVSYLKNHINRVQEDNYLAWGRFYAEILLPGKKDTSYYQRLLRREFKEFHPSRIILKKDKKKSKISSNQHKVLPVPKSYNTDLANKARKFLALYPKLGLYMAQIYEHVGGDKEELKYILDNSFWCQKDGSRYFYKSISDEDIIVEVLFGDKDTENEKQIRDEYIVDEENIKLLDDPELLIKKLKMDLKTERQEELQANNTYSELFVEEAADSAKTQRGWDREEVVILVTEYFRTKNLSNKLQKKNIEQISEFLRRREKIRSGLEPDDVFRNIAGITMQTSRIRCLDPDTKYNGMKGTKLQRQIVSEYLAHPRVINREAKEIFKKYKK